MSTPVEERKQLIKDIKAQLKSLSHSYIDLQYAVELEVELNIAQGMLEVEQYQQAKEDAMWSYNI